MVDQPSSKQGRIAAQIAGAPKAWPYAYEGGLAPYMPRKLPAAIFTPDVVNDPPYQHRARQPAQARIPVQAWQPNPWVYDYLSGRGPYTRKVPFTPSDVVDNPPWGRPQFIIRASISLPAWRPPIWPYEWISVGLGPYTLARRAWILNTPPFHAPGDGLTLINTVTRVRIAEGQTRVRTAQNGVIRTRLLKG